MTIPAADRRKEYPGNGTTTVFAGPRAFASGDIAVYLSDDATGVSTLVTTDDYTLTGVNANGATTVTMDTAPPEDTTLLILRTVAFTQETDITNQSAFLPEVMEDAYDELEQQIQQLDDLIDRAWHFGDTYIFNGSTELPPPEALNAIRWNDTATALENYLPGDTLEWPQTEETAGRVLTAADAFRRLNYGDYGEATFYLPASVFDSGDEFILVNNSTSNVTLVPNNEAATAPVTFYHSGSGRTWSSAGAVLAAHTVARIYMVTASRGYIVTDLPNLYVHESAVVNKDLQVTERMVNGVAALSSSAGVLDIDLSLANYFTLTLTENITSITFSNLPGSAMAQTVWLRINQGAGSAYTVAWPSAFKWEGGAAPSVSTTLSAYDVLAITSVDQGTRWEATLAKGWA